MDLEILSSDGDSWTLPQIDPNMTVDLLRIIIFRYLHHCGNSPNAANTDFKLTLLREGRALDHYKTLKDEELRTGDIIFFSRVRLPRQHYLLGEKCPGQNDIIEATRDLASPLHFNEEPTPNPLNDFDDLNSEDPNVSARSFGYQWDLKLAAVSLIKIISTFMKDDKDAIRICKEMQGMVIRKLKAAPKSIKFCNSEVTYPPPPEIECSPIEIIRGIKEVERRVFIPKESAVYFLKKKGFIDPYQIIDALRATNNNADLALKVLRSGLPLGIDKELEGLDSSSNLYRDITSDANIRLGLSRPKVLFVFINLVLHPSAMNVWLTDSDTSTILSTVYKLCHSESRTSTLLD